MLRMFSINLCYFLSQVLSCCFLPVHVLLLFLSLLVGAAFGLLLCESALRLDEVVDGLYQVLAAGEGIAHAGHHHTRRIGVQELVQA